jgi:hypothetical protein
MTQKIIHSYNRIVGSKFFPLFNLFLSLFYPSLILLSKFRFLPNSIKAIALINIYFYSRYNKTFIKYWSDRRSLLFFLSDYYKIDIPNSRHDPILYPLRMEQFVENNDFGSALEIFSRIKKNLVISESYNIFSEQRILYIGSAPVDYSNINFDSFDLVVVNNFLEAKLKKHNIPLQKTVIFYNKGFARRNTTEILAIEGVCKAIFVKEKSGVMDAPQFIDAAGFMFNEYGPMGAQNVLLGISLGSPEAVTVVGINGFLSKKPFSDDLKQYRMNNQHISNILRRHELVSNHNFLRLISKVVCINGCDEFLSLISLNSMEYCQKIDQIYGSLKARRIDGYGF